MNHNLTAVMAATILELVAKTFFVSPRGVLTQALTAFFRFLCSVLVNFSAAVWYFFAAVSFSLNISHRLVSFILDTLVVCTFNLAILGK